MKTKASNSGKKSIRKNTTRLRTIRKWDISNRNIFMRESVSLKGKFGGLDHLADIVHLALKGVKPDVFYHFAEAINLPEKDLAELINTSTRTISNYDEGNRPLEPAKGEHLLKLIALFKKGELIFGNLTEFQQWLSKPVRPTEGPPIEDMITPGGVDLVSQELDRIAYGYPI